MDKYTNPNFETSALITIDTQRDTLDGQPFEVPGTSDILPVMSQLLQAYREAKLPIHTHRENLSLGWIECGSM